MKGMNFSPVVSHLTSPFCCGIQKAMFLYPSSKSWLPGACCRLSHQSTFCEVLSDFEGVFRCQKRGKGSDGKWSSPISYVSSGLGLAPFTGGKGVFLRGGLELVVPGDLLISARRQKWKMRRHHLMCGSKICCGFSWIY